jgi:hypothetical protein
MTFALKWIGWQRNPLPIVALLNGLPVNIMPTQVQFLETAKQHLPIILLWIERWQPGRLLDRLP